MRLAKSFKDYLARVDLENLTATHFVGPADAERAEYDAIGANREIIKMRRVTSVVGFRPEDRYLWFPCNVDTADLIGTCRNHENCVIERRHPVEIVTGARRNDSLRRKVARADDQGWRCALQSDDELFAVDSSTRNSPDVCRHQSRRKGLAMDNAKRIGNRNGREVLIAECD